jgi:Dolichyl-phosphate-mannose-protein mannosyltransferase
MAAARRRNEASPSRSGRPRASTRERRPHREGTGDDGRVRIVRGLLGVVAIGFALFAFAVYLRRATSLFLSYPAPWPDEALFADVAMHLLRQGALGTDLYQGFLPGLSTHYDLTPPLYPLFLSGVFRVAGFGLVPLRMASLLVGVGVLILLRDIARRSGMSPWLALVPPALLALDGVFLRGSLIGRMDMLTLALVLLAFRLQMALPTERASASNDRRRSFVTGMFCGLAILSHPMGSVAIVATTLAMAVVTAGRLLRRSRSTGIAPTGAAPTLRFGFVLLGLGLCLLPWALYVLRDPHSFVEQFGRQLLRKSARDFWKVCLPMSLQQWGVGGSAVIAIWSAGFIGLVVAAFRDTRLRILALGQFGLFALALPSCELWYGLYLTPLTCLGVGYGVAGLGTRGVRQRVIGIAFAILAGSFTLQNAEHLARAGRLATNRAYAPWCAAISRHIPEGATVLLDGLPTPYFGLADRSTLGLRLYPPEGFRVPAARSAQALDSVDIVIAGPSFANAAVRERVEQRRRTAVVVGPPDGFPYLARIIRLRR